MISRDMEIVRINVEHLLRFIGLSGNMVPLMYHVLLIIISFLVAWLCDWASRRLFIPIARRLTKYTEAQWDDILFNEKVLRSACHIIPAIVIWKLMPMIFYQHSVVQEILARITAIYITVMSTRTAVTFIAGFDQIDTDKQRSAAHQYLKSFCGVLRILIICVSIVIIIALALGKNPMTLFAGLGATSAVLMLVFKDTIEGFAAGIRLTSNDMLHRGDWITVPGTDVNGIVKNISLTTVKVQNFDNTIITVSPKMLVNGSFQNWIGMQQSSGRRVQRKVYFDVRSIAFTDSKHTETNIGRFRKDVEEYLRQRKDVNADMLIMVRQIEATQCGIPMEFYFFLKQKEWKQYEMHLAEIMEHIYALAPTYGLKIYEQYPEQ